jgi:hypothetical protein
MSKVITVWSQLSLVQSTPHGCVHAAMLVSLLAGDPQLERGLCLQDMLSGTCVPRKPPPLDSDKKPISLDGAKGGQPSGDERSKLFQCGFASPEGLELEQHLQCQVTIKGFFETAAYTICYAVPAWTHACTDVTACGVPCHITILQGHFTTQSRGNTGGNSEHMPLEPFTLYRHFVSRWMP